MRHVLLLLVVLIPAPVLACNCLVTYPVCHEVATSDVVFIGTVESVGLAFLDPWHSRDPASAIPVAEIESLRRDGSPTAVARLKSIYVRMLGSLTDRDGRQLESATSFREVEAAFDQILARGRRAHFKVKTMFRAVKDDDDDDDDEKNLTDLDIWTDQSDCGIDFQKGETYLVYAGNDEGTGRLETSICYRTKRLSDAGADLAYLHFFRDGGNASSRIEGFVTSKWNHDQVVDRNRVESPASNLIVGLKSHGGVLYTKSGKDGRFIFDGLVGGDYDISVFAPAFPETVRILAGPQRVEVPMKGCASPVVVVSPWDIGNSK